MDRGVCMEVEDEEAARGPLCEGVTSRWDVPLAEARC